MFVLFTDSDCDMTPAVAKEYGYHIISMPYELNGKEVYPYEDFDVFDSHFFYDCLRHGAMPKTFALSPNAYVKYFEPFLKEGKDILYVHFSKSMSGTFNALSIAEKELAEKYPDRKIYKIDTKGITLISYNIDLEIGKLYQQGKSVEEIMKWAETEVDKFAVYFFATDLSFFKRSGRVDALSAVMGNLIGIKPIIYMGSDGKMTSIDKARGVPQTLKKIMGYVTSLQDDIENHKVIIGHADCMQIAKTLEREILKLYPKAQVDIIDVNPTAGCHCGPDTVGISFHSIHR